MELVLQRKIKYDTCTLGDLYVDGSFICNTVEDKDRELYDIMEESEVKANKVYGKTAIPFGKYKVDMNTVSPKFKDRVWAKPYGGKLPRLKDVKGFEGVLIHVGNTAEDSLGCILVGTSSGNKVINSTEAFNRLMKVLTSTSEDIYITIK